MDEDKEKAFNKVLAEMLPDLLVCFPELEDTLTDDLRSILKQEECQDACSRVKAYCEKIVPCCFFDILYENEEMFADESKNCLFLPGIDFALLWKENISDKTKTTIWKYLQLILFSTIENLQDKASFGDTADLFNAISKEEFEGKLEETMESMKDIFMKHSKFEKRDDMPDPATIRKHVDSMMGGKLGSIAKEIAEETLHDLKADPNSDDPKEMEQVFGQLFKNPTKLLGMVKTVGDRLDAKIKSGEIKESEMLEEATDMIKDLKNLPGMSHLKEMMGKMGMAGFSKAHMEGAVGAMKRKAAHARTKERMLAKLAARRAAKEVAQGAEASQRTEPRQSTEALAGDNTAVTPKKKKGKKKKGKKKK